MVLQVCRNRRNGSSQGCWQWTSSSGRSSNCCISNSRNSLSAAVPATAMRAPAGGAMRAPAAALRAAAAAATATAAAVDAALAATAMTVHTKSPRPGRVSKH